MEVKTHRVLEPSKVRSARIHRPSSRREWTHQVVWRVTGESIGESQMQVVGGSRNKRKRRGLEINENTPISDERRKILNESHTQVVVEARKKTELTGICERVGSRNVRATRIRTSSG